MEETISSAFSILAVGMITVILILWLVVIIGNLLIGVTNKYWPAADNTCKGGNNPSSLPAGTLAAIVAVVDVVTGGRGKVTKIEKE